MKKIGRPQLKKKDKKGQGIFLRVTEAEKSYLREQATAKGFPKVSNWIRSRLGI